MEEKEESNGTAEKKKCTRKGFTKEFSILCDDYRTKLVETNVLASTRANAMQEVEESACSVYAIGNVGDSKSVLSSVICLVFITHIRPLL